MVGPIATVKTVGPIATVKMVGPIATVETVGPMATVENGRAYGHSKKTVGPMAAVKTVGSMATIKIKNKKSKTAGPMATITMVGLIATAKWCGSSPQQMVGLKPQPTAEPNGTVIDNTIGPIPKVKIEGKARKGKGKERKGKWKGTEKGGWLWPQERWREQKTMMNRCKINK